jgi:putative acetyltransferase
MMIRRGVPEDADRALEIWRAAVDATHLFLSPADRQELDHLVAGFLPEAQMWIAEDAGRALGFLIMDESMIEALFVDPAVHGRGVGTALLQHALSLAPDARVDANEQATNALPFYESRGFVRTGRSETDQQGRPYPLVHLQYAGSAEVDALPK